YKTEAAYFALGQTIRKDFREKAFAGGRQYLARIDRSDTVRGSVPPGTVSAGRRDSAGLLSDRRNGQTFHADRRHYIHHDRGIAQYGDRETERPRDQQE